MKGKHNLQSFSYPIVAETVSRNSLAPEIPFLVVLIYDFHSIVFLDSFTTKEIEKKVKPRLIRLIEKRLKLGIPLPKSTALEDIGKLSHEFIKEYKPEKIMLTVEIPIRK